MPVDVVLAASGLEDEFLSRARPMRIHDVEVPTIDREDLIVAKILAGRPKDLAAIPYIESTIAEIDGRA